MTEKIQLGKFGEERACRYLVDKGYKILERNFWKPWGELDIIAKSSDKTLVFVEVKTVTKGELEPEMQLTTAKLKKLQRTASLYAGSHQELINDDRGWRIDLLALTLQESSGSILSESNGLTIRGKDCVIKHYENI